MFFKRLRSLDARDSAVNKNLSRHVWDAREERGITKGRMKREREREFDVEGRAE